MSEEPPIEEAPATSQDIENAYRFMAQSLAKANADRRDAEEKAAAYHYTATHDKLTGLLNRDGLDESLKDFEAAGKKLLVIVADVTKLKSLNDKHPDKHKAGDRLLITVAGLLQSAVRKDTIIARTGGDEFVIVMDATQNRDSYQTGHQPEVLPTDEVADRVRQRINDLMEFHLLNSDVSGADVHIATGYGIADEYDEAYQQADNNMYEHKQLQHSSADDHR